MPHDHLDSLRRRTLFDEWHNRPATGDDVFVVWLGMPDTSIPGWTLGSSRSVRDGTGRTFVYSTWVSDAGTGAVRIDVELTASRADAHEELLQRLASVQLADIERLADGSVGDIAFALAANAVVLFARGNTVVEVAPLTVARGEVLEVARAFDDNLLSRPDRLGRAGRAGRAGRRRGPINLMAAAGAVDRRPGMRTRLPDTPVLRSALERRSGNLHARLGLPTGMPLPADRDPSSPTVKLIVRGAEIRESGGRLDFVGLGGDGDEVVELVEHPTADE